MEQKEGWNGNGTESGTDNGRSRDETREDD
jgi:hypothetical protein